MRPGSGPAGEAAARPDPSSATELTRSRARGRQPADNMASRLPLARVAASVAAVGLWAWAGLALRLGAFWPALTVGSVAVLVSAGLVASLLLGRSLVAVAVRGQSMEPTFRDGDWVLVRRGRDPARGQVVVVRHPPLIDLQLPHGGSAPVSVLPENRWLVKRVVAVPGDPLPRDRVPALAEVPEDQVPPGKLILLGDNQLASFDSRRLGYFSLDTLLGVVVRQLAIRDRGLSPPCRPTTARGREQ
jgi:signal peptidase I